MSSVDDSKRTRAPRGQAEPKQSADGIWHLYPSLGTDATGKRIRKHIRAATRQGALQTAAALKSAMADNRALEPHEVPGTVGDWLTHWLNAIVPSYAKPSTWTNYEGAIRRSIMPRLGAVRLDRLRKRDVEALIESVATPSGKQLVLKTIKAALAEAERERVVPENVAERVKIRKPRPSSSRRTTGNRIEKTSPDAVQFRPRISKRSWTRSDPTGYALDGCWACWDAGGLRCSDSYGPTSQRPESFDSAATGYGTLTDTGARTKRSADAPPGIAPAGSASDRSSR